ncbi:MAG TPA: zinc ribbon domain-containing protein [Candidatus Deferrimicrobium sp.]|nr:zinc ribbon domain-containing protein [Candidatus Deferrimicrobium sp.]
MPLYEFQCKDCGHKFEDLVSSSAGLPACPICNSKSTVKLISLISAKGIASGCSTCAPSSCSGKFG